MVRLGRTPLPAVKIAPGGYDLIVERRGYEPWKATVTLEEGADRTLFAELRPLPATVTIVTLDRENPTWANIRIGNEAAGTSPVVDRKLPPGDHEVVADRPGFREARRTIRLKPGESAKLTLEIVRAE
jgi:hypothetical protein